MFGQKNNNRNRSADRGGDDQFWPKSDIVAALRNRFGAVDHLADDDEFSFYSVEDRDLYYVVALVATAPNAETIAEIGFIARFPDIELTDNAIQTINAQLHISLVVRDDDNAILIFGGVQASGRFSEASFNLYVDAWRRDLMVLLQSVLGVSVAQAHPAVRHAAVRRSCENRLVAAHQVAAHQVAAHQVAAHQDGAHQGREAGAMSDPAAASFAGHDEPAGDRDALGTRGISTDFATSFLANFAGPAGVSSRPCDQCGGRGKTGFFARACDRCAGSGFVAARR